MTRGVSPLTESMERMAAMPKIDLHLHLDGCVRPETLIRLARERKRPLPETEPERLLPYMQAAPDNANLTGYLSKFDFVLPHLQDSEALELVAFECVQLTADSGGVYVEVRFAPMLHTREGLTADDAIRAVLAGLKRGEAECGIPARAIVCCLRGHDEVTNLKAVEAAARFAGRGVGAVDLAGRRPASGGCSRRPPRSGCRPRFTPAKRPARRASGKPSNGSAPSGSATASARRRTRR